MDGTNDEKNNAKCQRSVSEITAALKWMDQYEWITPLFSHTSYDGIPSFITLTVKNSSPVNVMLVELNR